MKFLAFILAIKIFALSTIPCSDGLNFEDLQYKEISVEHNHKENSNDSCPVFCICNCCGISITYEPLAIFELLNIHKISSQLITTYQSNYRFDFHFTIWQPPKV